MCIVFEEGDDFNIVVVWGNCLLFLFVWGWLVEVEVELEEFFVLLSVVFFFFVCRMLVFVVEVCGDDEFVLCWCVDV